MNFRSAVGEAVDIDVLKEVCRSVKHFNKSLIRLLIGFSTKNKLPTSFTDKNETIRSMEELLSRDGVRTLIILCKVVLLKKHDGAAYSVIGNNQKTISCFFWLSTNISVKVIQQGRKVRARTNRRTNGLRVTDPRPP